MLYTSTEQYKYSDVSSSCVPHVARLPNWALTQGVLGLQVWDADMIHGCDCDIGWEGADCSLRTVRTTRDSKSCRPPPLTKPCVLHLPCYDSAFAAMTT